MIRNMIVTLCILRRRLFICDVIIITCLHLAVSDFVWLIEVFQGGCQFGHGNWNVNSRVPLQMANLEYHCAHPGNFRHT